MIPKDVKAIGAGLGGLSAACLLAREGHKVTVFEKNSRPGGKIGRLKAKGFYFDTGPSLLTIPFVLNELFERCGANLNDYLTIKRIEPLCRYVYPDGTIFDCYQDKERTLKEINGFAPDSHQNYLHFLEHAENIYKRTADAFLFNPLYSFRDVSSLSWPDLLRIDAFNTLSERIDKEVNSPYLRRFFKRFVTYNGSSPYKAPATLSVIAHVELSLGGYYVDGGMYSIIEALCRLAASLGVEIIYNCEVDSINSEDSRITSITTKTGEKYSADLIVSNSDATETYANLLGSNINKPAPKLEPSSSAFVLLLGIDKQYETLAHHTIFFGDDYRKEFRQIFEEKIMPDDPTIYVANTSASNPEHSPPGGSNLFILVNAPYLSDSWDWDRHKTSYADFIINNLERRGLSGLKRAIQFRHHITPVDFYNEYHSYKGSIYGTSSNSRMAAFLRPRNKSRNIDGLYLTGGSTHPGGGIPLVILSAFHVAELIKRYEY